MTGLEKLQQVVDDSPGKKSMLANVSLYAEKDIVRVATIDNFLRLENWLIRSDLLTMLETDGDMLLTQMEFVLIGTTHPVLEEFRRLLYHICDCEYGGCWQEEDWRLDSLLVSWLEEIEIRILQLSAEKLARALLEHLA